MAEVYLRTQDLAVGYQKRALIHDINLEIHKGEIVTLIGPNGSGKSTILKSITRQLALISGTVYIDGKKLYDISHRQLSQKMAVVLTERIRPELMTCHEIVATGRYPFTGRLGLLGPEDERKVEEAMKAVHAEELGSRDFNAISDGQRQRVLLARAICQDPEVIILDEPTSFLDIRHKLDLLSILRSMAKEKGMTVIMSLHEIDLAQKIADRILCVKGETISLSGDPEQVFSEDAIRDLYEIDHGAYDPLFGSVELPAPQGKPDTFVIAGAGLGIPLFRHLQKEGVPFSTGILYENDIDYRVARHLAGQIITQAPFTEISQDTYEKAKEVMDSCGRVLVTDVPITSMNRLLGKLIDEARQTGKAR